jgi:hypothetical protein
MFLVFISADCNFLLLISLLQKLSHPSPTALPTATACRSRAYGSPEHCQKWWPSPAPEQEAFDSVAASIVAKLKEQHEAESSRRRSKPRLYIFRDHEHAHEELVSQCFSEFPVYTD